MLGFREANFSVRFCSTYNLQPITYNPVLLWYFYIFLFGLIVGSFVNVVIYRVPRGESIVSGRSRCANCGKNIAWYDLIPIASFFILRFHCRQCRRRISWLYPVVELYSGLIFLLTFYFTFISQATTLFHYYPLPTTYYLLLVNWLLLIFLLESLLILAVIDLKNLILPDSVMLMMFLGVLAYGILEYLRGYFGFNIFSFDNFIGATVLFSALFLIWFFSKGSWLGLGDAKLAGLVGLIFGLWGGLIVIYGAIIAGMIAGLVLMVSHKANLKTKLPLGTFICLSATAYVFFGTSVQNKLADFFFFVPLILK